MANNSRSKFITEGVERAPNRAMLRAVGFRDEDFNKPIIGVANGYSTITPCNLSLGKLGEDDAVAAAKLENLMPQTFSARLPFPTEFRWERSG